MLQDVEEDADPEHWFPPYLGVGFVHDLDLDFVPLAQDLVQLPHDPHAV